MSVIVEKLPSKPKMDHAIKTQGIPSMHYTLHPSRPSLSHIICATPRTNCKCISRVNVSGMYTRLICPPPPHRCCKARADPHLAPPPRALHLPPGEARKGPQVPFLPPHHAPTPNSHPNAHLLVCLRLQHEEKHGGGAMCVDVWTQVPALRHPRTRSRFRYSPAHLRRRATPTPPPSCPLATLRHHHSESQIPLGARIAAAAHSFSLPPSLPPVLSLPPSQSSLSTRHPRCGHGRLGPAHCLHHSPPCCCPRPSWQPRAGVSI